MEMRPFLRKNLSDTVKAELYEYIDNLDLDKGTKLPPENTIAQNYGVSRVTVRRALDELEQEGVIIRIHGRGTFVNPQAKQFKINLGVSQELGRLVDQSGYEMRICLTAVETAPADIIVAKALGIPAECKVSAWSARTTRTGSWPSCARIPWRRISFRSRCRGRIGRKAPPSMW